MAMWVSIGIEKCTTQFHRKMIYYNSSYTLETNITSMTYKVIP